MKTNKYKFPISMIPDDLIEKLKLIEEKAIDILVLRELGNFPLKPNLNLEIKEPMLPYLIKHNKGDFRFRIIVLFLGIGCFFFFSHKAKYEEFSVVLAIIGFLIPSLIYLLGGIGDYAKNIELLAKYKKEFKEYKNNLKEYNDYMNFMAPLMEKYKQDYFEYSLSISKYNALKEEFVISKIDRNELFNLKCSLSKDILSDYVTNIKKPQKINPDFKKGISEKYFLNYLYKYFQKELIIYGINLDFFEPDFILKLNNGILIDIEIDEPYVGSSKEIIHYYDKNIGEYSDEGRNTYFLDGKWIVLRFSEEQIIMHPESCCKYIAELLIYLCEKSEINFFTNIADLEPQNIWSKEAAAEMAYLDYRKNYLTDRIIQLIINTN